MKPGHDELLRPSLSADYDVRSYRPLFRPEGLLYAAFFGGPLAGLILYGVNYSRMGRRDLARNAWIAGAVLTVVIGGLIAWYLADSWSETGRTRTPSWIRFSVNGLGVGIGWFVAKHQSSRFEAWQSAGNTPAKGFFPGLAAVLLSAVVMLAIVFGGLKYLGALD